MHMQYATCNMQHAHAAGHAVYLPSPRLTPFASFRLATPNCMYLCMPIARANPNPILILHTRGIERSDRESLRSSEEVILYRLHEGSSGSIYSSSELIDFEKFTNFIIIIVGTVIIITMSAGGGGRELEVPIHSK